MTVQNESESMRKWPRAQKSPYKILSYSIKHDHDVKFFLNSYRDLLQRAIDAIWDHIQWTKRGRRLIPVIPKSNGFKRELRNKLLYDWNYASHYVDSAVKVAYSIISSWRRNYVKGKGHRSKPAVKRSFVRVKETLYVYKNEKIRITVKPRELYLEFDISKAWFMRRVEGCDLGELILKEDELIITFRVPLSDRERTEYIGWDLNMHSLDGFSPKYGWIKIDLSKLYHIHRVHEVKRRKTQRRAVKKPSLKHVVSRHGEREINRARDFVHKLTTQLARSFPNAVHGFEDLDKRLPRTGARAVICSR